MTRALLLDFDGVLCDSLQAYYDFVDDFARVHGFTPIPPHRVGGLITIRNPPDSVSSFLSDLGVPKDLLDPACTIMKGMYDNAFCPQLYPGVNLFLDLMRDQFEYIAIVSANRRKNIQRLLKHPSVDKVFDQSDLSPYQGKASVINHIKRDLFCKDRDITFVGDQLSDYEAAQVARVNFIASGYGWQIRDCERHSFYVAPDLLALQNYLLSSQDVRRQLQYA